MCVFYHQDAVALRKIMSARKNELEQATKSSSQAASPLARVQRVRTRCSAVGAVVSGASLIAEIAALPDESDDEERRVTEVGNDAESELATV